MDFGYDEFGNRTGAIHRGSDNEEDARVGSAHDSGSDGTLYPHNGAEEDHVGRQSSSASSASNSDFGDDVELVIGEEGTQALSHPLVEADEVQGNRLGARGARHQDAAAFLIEHRYAGKDEKTGAPLLLTESRGARPFCSAPQSYMDVLANLPDRMRNVAMVGTLHHGKTSLVEVLLDGQRYPMRKDEVDRAMTLKCHVLTTVAGGAALQPTSRQMTIIDTPGHPDLMGEAAAGMRLADAVLFCVDVAESMSEHAERLLRHALVREQLPIILVLTKVDRLIMDLKLPPLDAYRKLRMVVDSVNNVIASCGTTYGGFLVSPERGTVCFASTKLGFVFSLETFARKYAVVYPSVVAAMLATKFWGQITYEKKAFTRITNFRQRPSFVQFVLEPLYKIVAHAVTGDGASTLSAALQPQPRSPLSAVQEAVRHFCGAATGDALDVVLSVLPTPMARSRWLSEQYGAGPLCASAGVDLVLAVASLQRVFDAQDSLAAVVRILHGTLIMSGSARQDGTKVPRLIAFDEHSSDADPYYEVTVQGLFLRTIEDGFVPVQRATAGQTVYVTGLPARSGAHVVLVGGRAAAAVLAEDEGTAAPDAGEPMSSEWVEQVKVCPLGIAQPLMHVAVEIRDPAKATMVQDGIRVLLRTSPGLDVHKEETGEYTMSGYGEMQLDTALHELRRGLCRNVAIGLSQPFVTFSETVHDTDGLLAMTGTRANAIGFVAGALPRTFTHALEYEQLNLFPEATVSVAGLDNDPQPRKLWTVLRREYGFDALDGQHILAAGPDATKGPSILIDDTLPEEMHHTMKPAHQRAIFSAFRATTAAGPLVGGLVRGVAAKLIFADVDPTTRDAVVLSNARTSLRHALFGARPRLLEPVLAAEIVCTPECVGQLQEILQQRRGALLGEELIAATTLIRARALVPAMDSFGLETQIRTLTHGQAFPLFCFHQWDVVPGDPFDASIHVGPLEPAKGYQLARDFVLKTRFRKGLPQNMMSDI